MGVLYHVADKASIRFGRSEEMDVIIANPYVSRNHMEIMLFEHIPVAYVKVHGRNGIKLNGEVILRGNSICINKSDLIMIGNITIIWLGRYIYIEYFKGICSEENASSECVAKLMQVRLEELGYRKNGSAYRFTATVREHDDYDHSPIEIEAPPARKQPEKPSIVLAVGPALTMALPMILGGGRRISAFTSIIAAVWAMGNVLARQKKIKNEERRRRNSYIAYIREMENTIVSRCTRAKSVLYSEFPEIYTYFEKGGNPYYLWNRLSNDKYDGWYRLGTGSITIPFEINIPRNRFAQYDDSLKNYPYDLKESYKLLRDVPVCIDISLVHCIGVSLDYGSNQMGSLLAFIMEILILNTPNQLAFSMKVNDTRLRSETEWIKYVPHYMDSYENVIASKTLAEGNSCIKKHIHLTDIPAKGNLIRNEDSNVVNIYITEDARLIPPYADIAIEICQNADTGVCVGRIRSSIGNEENDKEVIFDVIESKLCMEYARMMMAMWNGNDAENGRLSTMVSIGDLFEYRLSSEDIMARWNSADTISTLAFPIGMTQDNRILMLDAHEKGYGAHGLIGGSTGSGKSELLTTVILSAALSYPPDKLGFFLIDYKGGGMSNQFAKLPHVLGSISNLSVEDTKRAMLSLRSENTRRQEIFSAYSINNICDYTKLYDQNIAKEPLPHIFIIIDEFAELKKENPECMQEFVSIAAIGRSLGVHLILATQKPAGVIDDKIRSNSRFRICLRVESKMDSTDMLNKADAAFITECGRAYLQVGNDEIYTLFQSGYAMGNVTEGNMESIKIYDNKECLYATQDQLRSDRWLEYCLLRIDEIMNNNGVRQANKMWMPPLEDRVVIQSDKLGTDSFTIAVADCPQRQCYIDIQYSASSGHICIVGKSQSGKSVLAGNIIYGLMCSNNSEDYEIYIVDCSNGVLKFFEKNPRCGGYISLEDIRNISKLILFLKDILDYRKSTNTGDYSHIILVVDNYAEAIKEMDEDCMAWLTDIFKYGRSCRMQVIFTGMGPGDIPQRFINMSDVVFVLGKCDVYQTASMLSVQMRGIPNVEDIPGRGCTCYENEILKMQIVLYEWIEALIKCGVARATHYPFIPHSPDLDKLLNRISGSYDVYRNLNMLPLGYEEKTGRIYAIPFSKAKCIIISGKRHSDRKNILNVCETVMAALNISPLHVTDIFTLIDIYSTYVDSINKSNLTQIHNPNNHIFIIIDNLNLMINQFYEREHSKQQEMVLAKLFDNSNNNRRIIIIASMSDDERNPSRYDVYTALLRKPYVIYCGKGIHEQGLFDFSYLPYSSQNKKKESGATVLKYQGVKFYGEVVIPEIIGEEMEIDMQQNIKQEEL